MFKCDIYWLLPKQQNQNADKCPSFGIKTINPCSQGRNEIITHESNFNAQKSDQQKETFDATKSKQAKQSSIIKQYLKMLRGSAYAPRRKHSECSQEVGSTSKYKRELNLEYSLPIQAKTFATAELLESQNHHKVEINVRNTEEKQNTHVESSKKLERIDTQFEIDAGFLSMVEGFWTGGWDNKSPGSWASLCSFYELGDVDSF